MHSGRRIRHGLTSAEVADGVIVLSSGSGIGGTSNSTVLLDDDGTAVAVESRLNGGNGCWFS